MHALDPMPLAELLNNQPSSSSAVHEADAGLLKPRGEGSARMSGTGSSNDAAPEQQHLSASEDVEERQVSRPAALY